MKDLMRDEPGAPKIVDRSAFQAELDALRLRENAHTREGDAIAAARVAADWLCLAVTPALAIVALLTAFAGGQPDALCAAMQHASPLSGMVPMYLLMRAFHAAPWLKLIHGSVTNTVVTPRSGCGR